MYKMIDLEIFTGKADPNLNAVECAIDEEDDDASYSILARVLKNQSSHVGCKQLTFQNNNFTSLVH